MTTKQNGDNTLLPSIVIVGACRTTLKSRVFIFNLMLSTSTRKVNKGKVKDKWRENLSLHANRWLLCVHTRGFPYKSVSKPTERFNKAPRITFLISRNSKMAVTRYDIEKFDGKRDFTLQKAKIKVIVDQQKALKALTDPKKLPKTMTQEDKETMENAAYGVIVLNLSDNVLREIIGEETTYGMWTKLDEIYKSKDLPNRAYVREMFFTFKMDDNKSLTKNLGEFQKLSSNFKELEDNIGDENESFILLNSLSEAYKEVKWLSNMEDKKLPQTMLFRQ